MNQKTTESSQTSDVIRQLADHWTRVEVQAGDMTYTEYMDTVTRLHTVTNDLKQTKLIVARVLQQADALERTSEWLKTELRFEIIAAGVGDRAQLLSSSSAIHAKVSQRKQIRLPDLSKQPE